MRIIFFLQASIVWAYPSISSYYPPFGPSGDNNPFLEQFDDIPPAQPVPESTGDLRFYNWEVALPGYGGNKPSLTPSSTYQSIRIANTSAWAIIQTGVEQESYYGYGSSGHDSHHSGSATLYSLTWSIESLSFGCAKPTDDYHHMVPVSCTMHISRFPQGVKARNVFNFKAEFRATGELQQEMQNVTVDEPYYFEQVNYYFWATPLGRNKQTPVLYIDDLQGSVQFFTFR